MSEDKIKDFLVSGIERLFDLDKLKFSRIIIDKEIISSIIELAGINDPKEFIAFFKGIIKDDMLRINQLVYQQYQASDHSAVPIFHFNDRSFFGSVHSHPGYSNRPSNEDLKFFRKIGIVNCIICKPYKEESIRFFNHNGEEISVEIIDIGDEQGIKEE